MATKTNRNKDSKNKVHTLFFIIQLVKYFYNEGKPAILSTLKDMDGLFELYLRTEMAENTHLRQRMMDSIVRIRQLKSLIKSNAPNYISSRTLKSICDE